MADGSPQCKQSLMNNELQRVRDSLSRPRVKDLKDVMKRNSVFSESKADLISRIFKSMKEDLWQLTAWDKNFHAFFQAGFCSQKQHILERYWQCANQISLPCLTFFLIFLDRKHGLMSHFLAEFGLIIQRE